MDISAKLKELRAKKGLSQERVAEQLYVSRQAISKWENGNSTPDLEKIVKKGIDNKILTGCYVFDVYEGEHVSEGFKSVAFRVKMQDVNATLTDESIETQMANLRSVLKKSLPDLSFRE